MTLADLKDYYSNGMSCEVYIPENVNPDTEVFIFVHGGSKMNKENRENDWNSLINYQLEEHGSDSIVVMPTMGERWADNWSSNTMDIVESIRSDYGITNNNVTSCGFSFGGWGAINTTIENIKRNPGLEPQVIFMLDDYGNSSYLDRNVFNDGGKEALLENDSIVFSYINPVAAASTEPGDKVNQLRDFAESGINHIRVVCNKGFQHQAIKDNFFLNGMVDFTTGKVNLPSDGYTYQRAVVNVDPITGEKVITWEDVDVNNINTKEKLYSYFGLNNINDNSLSSFGGVGGSINGRYTYVDFTALQGWSNKMDAINKEMIEELKKMLSEVSSLKDSWNGNIATGFIEDVSNLIEGAQRTHNNMSTIPRLLIEVINIEKNL